MAEPNNDKDTTSAIDRVRNKESKAEKPIIDWSGLGNAVLNFLLKLIIIFIIGSRVVFACKVAQANILPTDSECMPYTPADKDVESPLYESKTPEANIDVMNIFDKDQEGYKSFATKIAFQINSSSRKDYLLDKIRRAEYDPNVSPMTKYLCVVIKNIFVFYYGFASFLFNFMNSTFNESFILLLGPYLLQFLIVFIYPVSIVLSIILCVINIGWLMKSNMNNDKEYKHKTTTEPVWRSSSPFSSFSNFFGTIIYLYVGFFLATILTASPIPAIIGLICILTPMFMTAKIIDTTDPDQDLKNAKTYGFMSSIRGLVETKLDVFMFIFCVYTTYATYKNSTDIRPTIFVALASLWFLYKTTRNKEPPAIATDKLASYDRNKKECSEKKLTKAEIAAIARDEADADAKSKEDYDKSWIGQIISFWTWFPKKAYDTLVGGDTPCPTGANTSNKKDTSTETIVEEKTPTTNIIAEEKTTLEPEPVPALEPVPEPKPEPGPVPEPVSESTSVPTIVNNNTPKENIQTGGKRDHLLRKIKNLTDTLKRRSK